MTMMDGLWVCEVLYGAALVALVWYPVFKMWRMGKGVLQATCVAGDSIAWTLRHHIAHRYTDLLGAMVCMFAISYWSFTVGVASVLVLVSVGVQILISKRCRQC